MTFESSPSPEKNDGSCGDNYVEYLSNLSINGRKLHNSGIVN